MMAVLVISQKFLACTTYAHAQEGIVGKKRTDRASLRHLHIPCLLSLARSAPVSFTIICLGDAVGITLSRLMHSAPLAALHAVLCLQFEVIWVESWLRHGGHHTPQSVKVTAASRDHAQLGLGPEMLSWMQTGDKW